MTCKIFVQSLFSKLESQNNEFNIFLRSSAGVLHFTFISYYRTIFTKQYYSLKRMAFNFFEKASWS